MIGIIPSSNNTFEVYGDFNSKNPVEGKLYYDDDGRLFMYTKSTRRSNPSTGYFPIWDGQDTYFSKFSNNHNVSEIMDISVSSISKDINDEKALDIKYRQRKSTADQILRPEIQSTDNSFTQIIKTIINDNDWTMLDLYDMCNPKLEMKQLENLYISLSKISFMRMERWAVWIDTILHLHYEIIVMKNKKQVIKYSHPAGKFDTGVVNYDSIVQDKLDPFKKIVRILIVKENYSKTTLMQANPDIDGYTVNNMFTTIISDKPFSAQLFSRFIKITGLEYNIKVYDKINTLLVDYKEG